jgi:hypothetical protein
MPEKTVKTTRTAVAAKVATVAVEPEREQFKALILSNPNYFGTLAGSPLKPVKKMKGNTSYEELTCVGLNPDLDKLEATVILKKDYGFSGGLCSAGSVEYVRFYLSYDNGTSWTDQGVTQFTAYNLQGNKPLHYAVTLSAKPKKYPCKVENLPKVRAILSWNHEPPADQPDYPPVWGNVLDARVQINPGLILPIGEVIGMEKAIDVAKLAKVIDLKKEIALEAPQALTVTQIHELYATKKIPAHRYLLKELDTLMTKTVPPNPAVAMVPGTALSQLGINLGAVIEAIKKTNGDTSYEELKCIGFNPVIGALEGVLTVKLPYGYSGTLCSKGSKEYVRFWVDWGDGVWKDAGTAIVGTHDLPSIPAGGLRYAVYLPVNFSEHCVPCQKGPVIARIRAILSWNVAPAGPDTVPTWGNRLEAKIHVYPGIPAKEGDYTPYLSSVCSIPVCSINQGTGHAPGDAPFGGWISIYGHIPGSPTYGTPDNELPRYRVSVRKYPSPLTAPWQILLDDLHVNIDEQVTPNLPTSTPTTLTADANGYFPYEDVTTSPLGWRRVVPLGLLARWNTAGKTGLWEIRVEAINPVTSTQFTAGTMICTVDGTPRQNVIVDLDQNQPDVSIAITGYKRGSDPAIQPAKDCGTFQVGDIICGTYTVTDGHFSYLTLTVEPAAAAAGTAVDPAVVHYTDLPHHAGDTVGQTGASGTWEIDTKNMKPCGYTVRLHAWDRTIVHCSVHWENEKFVGFCLRAK